METKPNIQGIPPDLRTLICGRNSTLVYKSSIDYHGIPSKYVDYEHCLDALKSCSLQ